ncbi:CTP:molybdopterin cytidylyltransferase MocA [Cribrihabitans marinus]|uniref:CTP:molybdopterin cytidylyltransferase MocA n=1 Tax=Cribrihabitans marinus TaxID=1227549 RepID=A0A1H6QKT5_9RHOB|nr:nucleotidyltransferase family protein [Cribrihabitans marinus]GGH19240.1 molybdopterin-guanine dinucleotide biosynthesis protein A [Cribrihabitans marinus]SEI44381.1 CTP:molybdopterin cytidylyltransferase MocA [Cribrihabitans marinus]
MEIPIIILAAGQSRRMQGRDKLLEVVDGKPLVRRQAQMARRVTTAPVIVALPPEPHRRHDVLADLEVQRLSVPDADEGMNASLRRAFAALPDDARAAMLVLADLPDLTGDDLRTVLQVIDLDGDTLIWRGTTVDGEPGHPIVFRADLFDAMSRLRGDGGARSIVAAAGPRVAHVPLPGRRARNDLDTPEAWAAWRRANPGRAG